MPNGIAMSLQVGIVGASIAGLLAAHALHSSGAAVRLFERSTQLVDRGAGIMLDPQVASQIPGLCTRSYTVRRVLDSKLQPLWTPPLSKSATSWQELYRCLRARVPDSLIETATVLSCSPEGELKTDGGIRKFDLVVGADGIGSTVRRCVDPDFEPKYCGYVAIRGTVEAGNLPSSAIELWRHITAGQLLGIYLRQAHVVMYAPPAQKTGNNTLNWVWYHNYDDLETLLTDTSGQHHRWSLPPDRMSAEFHDDLMRQAFEDFPEPLAEILAATRAPYLQAIFHGLPKSFVHGRAVLVGDAAHVSTPHLGAASSLAYHDVQSLARALAEGQSLQDWSATRHEAVKDTLETSYAMGQALQFAEQSWDDWATQDFDNWWQKLISGRRPYFDP